MDDFRARSTLVQQYSPIMEQRHKQSAAEMVQQTAESLSNAFACDEPSPEDLIFNLFKIPNKEEASIGKLIMVMAAFVRSDVKLVRWWAKLLMSKCLADPIFSSCFT